MCSTIGFKTFVAFVTNFQSFIILFFFQFSKLHEWTQVDSYLWLNLHQIGITSEIFMGNGSNRGFLAFCDEFLNLYNFYISFQFSKFHGGQICKQAHVVQFSLTCNKIRNIYEQLLNQGFPSMMQQHSQSCIIN